MQVAELTRLRHFDLVDRPLAEPGPGQLQVRVSAVGICGSDMHNYGEGGIGGAGCQYPQVLGHEPSGVIVKTGVGVTGFAPGDRGSLEPSLFCYHCHNCMRGRHNLCPNMRFMSSGPEPGYFREFVNIPVINFLPIPADMSLEQAALAEPLSIALHSLVFAQLKLGETAAVFGAGPIGLMTIAALKLSGAGRVWAIEPLAHRRELAKLMGADAVIDPTAVAPDVQVMKDTGRHGVDLVIDCASKEDMINICVRTVAVGGRIVLTGIPSELRIPVNIHDFRNKEVSIFNVRRSNNEGHLGVTLLRDHPKLFLPVVTHTRPLDKINEAFELNTNYQDGVGKLLLRPGN
jgi:L-iditol 2-dehydrogenase